MEKKKQPKDGDYRREVFRVTLNLGIVYQICRKSGEWEMDHEDGVRELSIAVYPSKRGSVALYNACKMMVMRLFTTTEKDEMVETTYPSRSRKPK